MKKELIAQRDPKSPVSEVFRTLRTNIQFMNSSGKLKTLLVTSTLPGEGKSWVTSNLAVTFAQAGKKVILIDADMRKGRQYTIFGVSPIPGLSNYLSGINVNMSEDKKEDITQYLQETAVPNLYLLSAGNIPPNPSELLVSPQMVNLLDRLKEMSDIVIIDGTPCELVTDSLIITRIVDSTIIVTASKETRKDNLQRVITNIQNVGGKLAGVVLNKVPISQKKYQESYYYGSTAMAVAKDHRQSQISQMRANTNSNNNISTTRQNNIQPNNNSNNFSDHSEKNRVIKNSVNLDNTGTISLEKTNQILRQINEYVEKEKKNLN